MAFQPPSICLLGSHPLASLPCRLECHTLSITPAGIPSAAFPYLDIRKRVRWMVHTTNLGSPIEPLRKLGGRLRLLRNSEMQRTQRTQQQPSLQRTHHRPKEGTGVPELNATRANFSMMRTQVDATQGHYYRPFPIPPSSWRSTHHKANRSVLRNTWCLKVQNVAVNLNVEISIKYVAPSIGGECTDRCA